MLILKMKIYQICYGLTSGFKLVSSTVSRSGFAFEFGTTCWLKEQSLCSRLPSQSSSLSSTNY